MHCCLTLQQPALKIHTTGPENSEKMITVCKVNKPNYQMHRKALCSLVGFILTNYMRKNLHLLTRSLRESGITISTVRLNKGVQL